MNTAWSSDADRSLAMQSGALDNVALRGQQLPSTYKQPIVSNPPQGKLSMQPSRKLENAISDLFQAIVEQAPDAIIFADRDGLIQVWNRGAETIFGYSAAEVVGKSLDVIIPERLRRAHWEGFRRAVESGQTKYGNQVLTTRSVHKNGSKLYVDLSFALVKDRTGAVSGALAIGRDCMKRYLSDGVVRARVAELEQALEAASNRRQNAP